MTRLRSVGQESKFDDCEEKPRGLQPRGFVMIRELLCKLPADRCLRYRLCVLRIVLTLRQVAVCTLIVMIGALNDRNC